MNLSEVKTIFLDYDGTLHNSLKIYKPAFLETYKMLVQKNYKKERKWSDQEISLFLGQSPKDMWDTFGAGLPESVKAEASDLIGKLMRESVDQKLAELYQGAIETLAYLKNKGYTLVFISNCTEKYMVKHTQMFNLNHYFDLMVNAQMYQYQPKENMIDQIKNQLPKEMVIVGDRSYDILAGQKHDFYTIGCAYGFGTKKEIENADMIIKDIRDLQKIL